MYNLENHLAFNGLKNLKIISTIINALFQENNFSYYHFNKLINEAAIDLAKELYPNNCLVYSNKNFISKEDFENKIKGDLFEIFVMFFLQYFEKVPNIIGIKEGTYYQVDDSEDAGMDFYGIKYASGNNERVFGQIKYRNPNIVLKPEQMAFTRDTVNKCIGNATIKKRFNLEKDLILLVTNRSLEDSLHYRIKDEIGFVGNSADFDHSYIKFIDATIFQNILGYNEATFWNEFKAQF